MNVTQQSAGASAKRESGMKSRLQQFMELEAAGGIALGIAALVALLFANSPLGPLYTRLLEIPLSVQVGGLVIAKPLLMWINDGLMAVFFALVAMEIKREIREGDLSTPSIAALPAVAALGGMLGPALLYLAFTWGDSDAMRGWAIPTATDIASPSARSPCLGRVCQPHSRCSCWLWRSSTISARS
jgi:Na+:H+ antiporter, NhaA family